MRVGIIGTNLMGRRRAIALKAFPGCQLTAVASAHFEKAQVFAKEFGSEAEVDWKSLLKRSDVDVVLVCTTVATHAEIVIAALSAGKHVLCEKPLARTAEDGEAMVNAAEKFGKILKCGFNHRYHPAVRQAKQLLDDGEIGKPNFIRCRYGICGRPGYSKEWRMDPNQVGGGHLMEHGIHAIDLFRWFLGDLKSAAGFTASYVVDAEGLEDNAFALFQGEKGEIAQLHSSLTQWRNLFSFEIYGENGYLSIQGLGGSYGTEKLTRGLKSFDRPFTEDTWEYRGEDTSWKDEWEDFSVAIQEKKIPLGTGRDGLEAMKLVQAVYRSNEKRQWAAL